MSGMDLPVKKRSFLPHDLYIDSWSSVEPYYRNLLTRPLRSVDDLVVWLQHHSELSSAMEEEQAWRYIRMNCDTTDSRLSAAFEYFITTIFPEAEKLSHQLDMKLIRAGMLDQLDNDRYLVFIRALKRRTELFREENVPLLAALQVTEQEYGRIMGGLTVHFRGKELTLQQAANLLRDTDRDKREQVFALIHHQRIAQVSRLQDLYSELVGKRMQVSNNAGFASYRDYKFAELGRFDYTADDCLLFRSAVRKHVKPLVERIHRKRQEDLGYRALKPWDLDVNPTGREPFKPFDHPDELVEKTVQCFNEIRPGYGEYLERMHRHGFMDLGSRPGKAPGGFNYPLYESNVPFIFMNAVGNQRDVETLAHEGGHAIHSFLTAGLPLVEYKSLPAEVAELASMSMELIFMEHWHHFSNDVEEIRRARRNQLEEIITILPWIICVDAFQHWVYTHPGHTHRERDQAWIDIAMEQMSSVVDYTGVEEHLTYAWQRQLHIFEMPFYYIEYAIAQLGAISVWRNYRENPSGTLDRYESALRLGYSKPIPEIYRAAGIPFDFSETYINSLMKYVWNELEQLYR